MNKKEFLTHAFALSLLVIPSLAFAHGGVDDGDGVVDPDGHHAGASELLVAFSSRWWGLMAVAVLLMSSLSFGVWKYLQVETPKPAAGESEKKVS